MDCVFNWAGAMLAVSISAAVVSRFDERMKFRLVGFDCGRVNAVRISELRIEGLAEDAFGGGEAGIGGFAGEGEFLHDDGGLYAACFG